MLLIAVAFFQQAGLGGESPWYGIWGGYFDGSTRPYHMSVRGVDPGGPADQAGIREGDLVDGRDQTVLGRLSMMGQPLAGRPIHFSIQRGGVRSTVTLVPLPFSFSRFWQYGVWDFTNLWLLLFAALIAWRRPFVDNNLLLSSVLASLAIGFGATSIFFSWPVAWPYVAMVIVSQALPLAIALFAALSSSFARPLSTVRRAAAGVCYALVGLAVVIGYGTPDQTVGLAPLLATLTLWFDPTAFLGAAWAIPVVVAVAVAILCSALAVFAARGVERQRAGWLLVPLAVLYGTGILTTLAFHFLSYAAILATSQIYSVAAIVVPLVLTYAALNRRLIDVGFVLNRTVVFAIVSTIVIGAFVLVEWAAGAWLVNASHTTSAIVGMVVALVLGLSLRYIHRFVDRFVDRVFFRKRHDDESALRRFAHESSYINDASTLLQRATNTVRAHTTTHFANIFVRNGSATYASTANGTRIEVGENDPAIVALAAWNKPVDLHEIVSKLPGEAAFPMTSRGRLVGVLVCGPKRDGEAYAPDESDALLSLARGVGAALDVLDAKDERSLDPALAELRESVR